MRCDMSDSKKEENKSPLDELRLFCWQNKKKWWFVLFFPSDLANELNISNLDSTNESIYEKYSFRRSWLGILQSLNFFSDPKILDRMDEEIKLSGKIFSGFEIAETEQNGDVQESAQKFVTSSDLKGVEQTNNEKLKRTSIWKKEPSSKATIASSLSKQDSDILNFLNEPLNESLKASIKTLTQESKDKLSTIIQMKGMYSKNLIRKIINKKQDNGMHDDRLLILFYYLVENKQIFFPLDPRIEKALSMLSEGSLQAYNQAIEDEKDRYKPVKITINGETKESPNVMIGLFGFKLLSSFNNINDVMGKEVSASLVSDVHDGSPSDAGAALVSAEISQTARRIARRFSFYHSNKEQSSASENHLPGSPNTVASPPSPNKGNQ